MTQEKKWSPHWQSNDVEIKSSTFCHEGHFKVFTHQLRYKKFSGQWSAWIDREQIKLPRAVGVILYDPKQDNLVLVEQFRVGPLGEAGAENWLLEVVAGYVDDGETLEDAVIREAKEEANVVVEKLIHAHDYYSSPGGLSERLSIFCGIIDSVGVGGVHGVSNEHEDIKVHVLKYIDVERDLTKGMLTSSSTLIALLWLKMNRAHLQGLGYL